VAGQSAVPRYDASHLDGAIFSEELRSEVRTESATATQVRTILRRATYSVALRRDTLLVTADTVWLHEDAEGAARDIDVDPVIGARWKLLIDPRGTVIVADAPVVTRDIADVSDVSLAMNDFFPLAPPSIAVRGTFRDSTGLAWRRLADSSGSRRYHLSQAPHTVTTHSVADSVAINSTEDITEDGDLVWDPVRGPIAWTRHITSVVTSRFASRALRAAADQHITIRRVR